MMVRYTIMQTPVRVATVAALAALPAPAAACAVALAFAVDVSGSVSAAQYRVQMEGLATALRDPVVSTELAGGEAALMLTQWTGTPFQEISLPWRQVASAAEVDAFAREIAALPRAYSGANTALGDALAFTRDAFAGAPACDRQVIDVSGNGRANEGAPPGPVRADVEAAGMMVNAIVLQSPGQDLARYFADEVIAGPGAFVVTVGAPEDYPEKMRQKLLRELAVQLVMAD